MDVPEKAYVEAVVWMLKMHTYNVLWMHLKKHM